MLKKEWEIYKQEIKEAIDDLKTKGRRKKQIPNILTSLRLLAPLFILPASFLGNIPFIVGSVVVFSATDMLDGFIARTFQLTSHLGRDLDAFSDKVFAGTLLLASSMINPMLLLTFSLEASIAGINMNAKLKGIEAKSLTIGKVKTFFLFPLLGCSLISSQLSLEPLFNLLFASTTILQVITAANYQRNYKSLLQVKEEVLDFKEEENKETDIVVEEKEEEKTIGEKTISKTSADLASLRDIRKSLVGEVKESKPFFKIKR